MATVKELQAQIDELHRQILEISRREKAEAISIVKGIMEDQGLTVADIAGGAAKRGRPLGSGGAKGSRVAPKYRDPITGKEWAGRGVAPIWIRGRNRDEFLIKD